MQSRLLPEAAQFEVLPLLTQEQYDADRLDEGHEEEPPLAENQKLPQAGSGSKESAAGSGSQEVAAGSGSKGSAAAASSGSKGSAEPVSGASPADDFFGAEECPEEEEQEVPDPVFDAD